MGCIATWGIFPQLDGFGEYTQLEETTQVEGNALAREYNR